MRIYTKAILWLCAAVLSFCIFFTGCRKTDLDLSDPPIINSPNTTTKGLTVAEARTFFEKEIANSLNKTAGRSVQQIENTPIWDAFNYRLLQGGSQAVLTPLHKPGVYVKVDSNRMVKYSFLNYMLMYRDSLDRIITEWVTLKPSLRWYNSPTVRKYDGLVIVQNWEGDVKAKYRFNDGALVTGAASANARVNGENDDCQYYITYKVDYHSGNCPCEGHSYGQSCQCPTQPVQPYNTFNLLVEVYCPDDPDPGPSNPGGGGNPGNDPNNPPPNPGGGGGPNPGDYPPTNCNPDPNYTVPTVPPPPGQEWVLPCSETQPPTQPLTANEMMTNFFQSLSQAQKDFCNEQSNSPIIDAIVQYLLDQAFSGEAKDRVKWAIDFLISNTSQKNKILHYLTASSSLDQKAKNEIVLDHLSRLKSDPEYVDFVEDYETTNTTNLMWWENETWLSDPDNFNLDISSSPNEYGELTAQEKILVALYPIQAFVISTNVDRAFQVSAATTLPGPLNGRQDAFRHAFFQAINTRDVPAKLFPVPERGASIVKKFADAHESEVPTQLQLEKEMDLFNNQVGIDYCWNCWTTSDGSIRDAIIIKLNNGELRYLAPLDFNTFPLYHPQACPTCTNGIGPATRLTPTNQ